MSPMLRCATTRPRWMPGVTAIRASRYSRAYIHHLFRAQELLGIRLVSLHNVAFLLKLMRTIRQSIIEGRFAHLRAEWLEV
jgi:queuine tRNA-ribosyltransferase